jgi:hypothetical protein
MYVYSTIVKKFGNVACVSNWRLLVFKPTPNGFWLLTNICQVDTNSVYDCAGALYSIVASIKHKTWKCPRSIVFVSLLIDRFSYLFWIVIVKLKINIDDHVYLVFGYKKKKNHYPEATTEVDIWQKRSLSRHQNWPTYRFVDLTANCQSLLRRNHINITAEKGTLHLIHIQICHIFYIIGCNDNLAKVCITKLGFTET